MILLLLLPVILGLGAAVAISDDAMQTVLVWVIQAIGFLIEIVFMPINMLLDTVMPQFGDLLGYIQPIFDAIANPVAWVLNSVFISGAALGLVIAYYTVRYSISISIWTVKIVFKWKNALL